MRRRLVRFGGLEQLERRDNPSDYFDLPYAATGNPRHVLDLHVPDSAPIPIPVVVWIHGGGWQRGDEDDWFPAQPLVDAGFAVASVSYRLTSDPGSPHFPDPIHDVKGAVRWLRANAATYGLDPQHFGAMGSSAGGHLAALLGTSGGVTNLEGTIGGITNQSSSVQAVVDLFGPADLFEMWQVPGYAGHGEAGSPESLLIGATVKLNEPLADAASPVTYASADDPPFLIFHGTGTGNTGDGTVPWQQSQLMHNALLAAGANSELHLVPNASHSYGSIVAQLPTAPDMIVDFFSEHLKTTTTTLPLDGTVSLTQITGNSKLNSAGLTGYDYTLTRTDSSTTTGVLIVPNSTGPAPAVVVNHGAAGSIAGARTFGINNGFYFAQAGYVVIAPIYEHAVGNTAFNTAENYRRAADAVAMLLHIDDIDDSLPSVTLPSVATDKIGMFGNSKGAYLTIALAQDSAVKPYLHVAGITAGGCRTNGSAPPASSAPLIDIPFVIQHSEDDGTVPFSEAQALWDNLRPEIRAASVFQSYADLFPPGGPIIEDPDHGLISARPNDVFPLAIDFFNGVLGLNPSPALSLDDMTTNTNTPYVGKSIAVLTNDTLPVGSTIVSITQPGHGITAIQGNNVVYTYSEYINGTTDPDFFGDDFFTYTIATPTNVRDTARVRVQVRPSLPATATIQINDGSVQRSLVKTFTVTFSEPVAFPDGIAAAIQLQRTGPGVPTGNVNLVSTGGGTTYTFTFGDPVFAPTSGGKSLIDGLYTITLLANKIQGVGGALDGDGDGNPGGDQVLPIHRLFGDGNGDRRVDSADFAAFRSVFGTSNVQIFDADNDGVVNSNDFAEFRKRFGMMI